ncbi:DUF1990 family protein [Nocardioides korecus]
MRGDGSLQRWREVAFNYPDVGATRGTPPAGYHHLSERVRLGAGPQVFDDAATGLLGWEMHRRAGVRVDPAEATITRGTVALLRLGLGRVAIKAPVRVVNEVDELDRRGFAYGTLVGHPEAGEELFVVERDRDGTVFLQITAFSRPATRLARCAGPLGRLVQRLITERYLRALVP